MADWFEGLPDMKPNTVGWKKRIQLWCLALACQVRGFKYTEEGVTIKGWIHCKTSVIYVTQVKQCPPAAGS